MEPINIITIVAFMSLVAMFMILGTLMMRLTRDPIRDRLESLARGETQPNSSSFLEGLAQQLPESSAEISVLEAELRRAGYYRPAARTEFLGLRNGLMVLVVLLTGFAVVLIGPEDLGTQDFIFTRLGKVLLIGVIGAGFCWALPRIVLRIQGAARLRRITEALPYSLDMITMSLSGGLSLQDALYQVSREMYYSHQDLAIELLIIRQHAEISSLELAFEQFAHRIDSPEISSMASLVTQGQRLGTDVVTSINEYADDLRLKRRQTADAKSSRASSLMLIPLTVCLMPSVMFILWGPAVIDLMDHFRNFEGPGTVDVSGGAPSPVSGGNEGGLPFQ